MAAAAQVLRCGHCSGPVPVLAEGTVTCLYCLRAVSVPPDVAAPLAIHREAKTRIDQSLAVLAAARRSVRGPILMMLLYGVVVFAIGGTGVLAVSLVGGDADPTDTGLMLSRMIMLVGYGGLVFAFGGGGLYARRHAKRRLAALPLARLSVDETLHAGCAVCGAPLAATDDSIKARCDHCGNESLMPAPLVRLRLQAKHRKIIEVHARIENTKGVVLSASEAINRFATYTFIAMGLVLGLGYIVYFQIVPLPPHLVGTERLVASFCPGLFMAFVFVFPAAMSLFKRAKR